MTMARNLPESGQIIKLQEVINGSAKLNGQAVRLMAKLHSYDCVKQQGTICSVERSYNQHLYVDTRLIEPFEARLGSVFQFIGELDSSGNNQPVLRARVVRCVDGVDVALYYKAVDVQRMFLEHRKASETESCMNQK